jgi:hypothetical protein
MVTTGCISSLTDAFIEAKILEKVERGESTEEELLFLERLEELRELEQPEAGFEDRERP